MTQNMEDTNCFGLHRVISQGTFGRVYQATDNTGRDFALKTLRIRSYDKTSPREFCQEVEMVKLLKHKHVVRFIDSYFSKDEEDQNVYHLLFELCSFDLRRIVFNQEIKLPLVSLKTIAFQILKGLEFVHKNLIMHRDLKHANILVSKNGVLKIADFGLATFYDKKSQMKETVCTLGYRAPELLLGCNEYDYKIDIWSVGIVIAELYLREHLILGTNPSAQLNSIVKIFGTINESIYPRCGETVMWHITGHTLTIPRDRKLRAILEPYATRVGRNKISQVEAPNTQMKTFYDEQGMNFLDRMLKVYPVERAPVTEFLNHAWFRTDPLPGNNIKDLVEAVEKCQNQS